MVNGVVLDYDAPPPAPLYERPSGLRALAAVGWALLMLWLLLLIAAPLGLAGGAVGGIVPGLVLEGCVLATLFSVRYLLRSARERRARLVLGYVEQAVRLNLPLPKLLWAACENEGGLASKRLGRLAIALEAGMPLAAAIAATVPEMPPRWLALLQTAEHLGRLAPTLRRLVREKPEEGDDATGRTLARIYPLVMATMTCGLIGLLAIFVFPKFQQIFKDFRVPISPRFHMLAGLVSWLVVGAVALAAIVFYQAATALREVMLPWWKEWEWTVRVRDGLIWCMPLAGRLARDRGLADVCEVAADAMEAGSPLDRALREAVELHLNAVLRSRVRQWLAGVAAGESAAHAARAAGLPPLLVGMLASAAPAGSMAAAMRFLAQYYGGRYSRLAVALQAAILPAMALFFGMLTCAVALTLFQPLVTMIQRVMPMGKLI